MIVGSLIWFQVYSLIRNIGVSGYTAWREKPELDQKAQQQEMHSIQAYLPGPPKYPLAEPLRSWVFRVYYSEDHGT